MKKKLQSTILVILLCFCVLFSACGKGISGSEAKAHIQDFFTAIAEEDYTKAEDLLHPERPADLEDFFVSIEKTNNIDFQQGIQIQKYTGFSSALYDSTVKGSRYELTMKTEVGKKAVEFTIEIVKNDAGYGIYNINLDAR